MRWKRQVGFMADNELADGHMGSQIRILHGSHFTWQMSYFYYFFNIRCPDYVSRPIF
jgi:hypothetical protein